MGNKSKESAREFLKYQHQPNSKYKAGRKFSKILSLARAIDLVHNLVTQQLNLHMERYLICMTLTQRKQLTKVSEYQKNRKKDQILVGDYYFY